MFIEVNPVKNSCWPTNWIIPAPGDSLKIWEPWVKKEFPGLIEALSSTPQDKTHHAEGDVWTHTKMVIEELLNSDDYFSCNITERGVLFTAALLHDIRKPETTKQEGERIIAPGHSSKGATATRGLLWKKGVDWGIREEVSRIIEVHQVPFFAFNSKDNRPVETVLRELSWGRSLKLLTYVARADMRGRIAKDKNKILDDILLFEELSKELNCFDNPYKFPDEWTRIKHFQNPSANPADFPLFRENKFNCLITSGLPASGKSTWCEQMKKEGYDVFGYDDAREELGIDFGDETGKVIHHVRNQMKENLRKSKPFILNATNLSKNMRERNVEMIMNYGANVEAVCFEVSWEEIKKRNTERDSSISNERIESMIEKWQMPGLDEVHSRKIVGKTPVLKSKFKTGV